MKKSVFFISTNSTRVFTFFLFCLFCAGRLSAATWYVKPTGSDANAGNSWAAAYQTLTKALQSAASGDQIWVASGTYKPTTGTDRGVSFNMKNGVAIYGGFPATGNPVMADRNWNANVTMLSGDIGAAGDNSDNSYNIIANVNNGLTTSAILDGFTVTGGNANGGAFVNWFGGGMYLGSSSPTIRNCTFSNNNALYGGGGVAAFESSATISACVFNGNYSAQDGGGLGLYGTTISVNNCVFTGNSAASFGAAIYSGTSNNATLTNCSFSGNSGYPIILNSESTFNLKNGIIWENTGDVINNFNGIINVSNSIVQGGYAGNGNLSANPLFVDQANGDLRLQTCSPAINKGDNAAVPAGVTTDLDGNNRFFGTVDMGAYEYQGNPPVLAVCKNITVQLDATGNVTVPASAVDNGSTVACGIAILTLSKSNFNCSNVGNPLVSLEVKDNDGNKAYCSTTITVQDNIAPTALCKNATVQLDATGNVTVPGSAVDNGSSDVCGIAALTLSKTNFNCSNVGSHLVSLEVRDNNGNKAYCSTTLTIQDNIAPTAVCQNATIQLDASGNATLAASAINNGSADACGIASLSLSKTNFDCSNIGANTVTLTVTDNNGKTAICSATVTVQDNSAPTVTCPEDITISPDQITPCSAVVNNLTATYSDNCSAALSYTLTGATSSTGNGQANGQRFNTGVTIVTYTVDDGSAHTATCVITITVGACISTVSGKLIWENDDISGVGNAVVSLGGDESGSVTTTSDGHFSLSVTPGSDVTITTAKTINKLNGVTAADATRIQQHVANTNPFSDLYKIVAADVNKSNSVTMQDASIINQALLGNPTALAQFKTSWRFVPVAHPMSNPPWGFPENITLDDVEGNVSEQNFFGIKTGDVITPSTNPANFGSAAASAFVLNVHDQTLEAGTQVRATFNANQFSDLAALQFALQFDVEKLILAEIQPLAGLPFAEENFGIYNVSEGSVNVVWSQAEGVLVEEAAPVFQLTFNVLETGGKLSEALQLGEDVLPAHAYTGTLSDHDVQLKFFGVTSANAPAFAKPVIQLLQNNPNPFVDRTTIGFILPEACEAQLRIFNDSGRLLAERKKQYPTGKNEEVFEMNGISGVLYYELTTPFGVLTKKMIRTR